MGTEEQLQFSLCDEWSSVLAAAARTTPPPYVGYSARLAFHGLTLYKVHNHPISQHLNLPAT